MRAFLAPEPFGPHLRTGAPTFSVIIAAYQAAGFISDALDSVLAQTAPPFEIVVCDDGSTDDLSGALAPYRRHIRLLRKENAGEGSAKNAAARAASGDFVAILDADDVYLPERMEALTELSMARPDLDILTTDCFLVVDGQRVRNCYHAGYRFETEDQRLGILRRNFLGPGHMAVRRSALLEAGGFDEAIRWATDWECWIRMILAGSRAGMVDEPLAEYRIRRTGLASDRLRMVEGSIALLEKTARRSDLQAQDRTELSHTLESCRKRLVLGTTRTALREGRPEARRMALDLMRDSSFPYGLRLRAALAGTLPWLAARRLVAREGDTQEVAGGLLVPSRPVTEQPRAPSSRTG